ncbi:MAG TPA: hypothetical protein VHP34_09110, partial [Alphaproteobacteria bacterium]|nr:hypothetical protein [Alphaproteobacteria bacterium]
SVTLHPIQAKAMAMAVMTANLATVVAVVPVMVAAMVMVTGRAMVAAMAMVMAATAVSLAMAKATAMVLATPQRTPAAPLAAFPVLAAINPWFALVTLSVARY